MNAKELNSNCHTNEGRVSDDPIRDHEAYIRRTCRSLNYRVSATRIDETACSETLRVVDLVIREIEFSCCNGYFHNCSIMEDWIRLRLTHRLALPKSVTFFQLRLIV